MLYTIARISKKLLNSHHTEEQVAAAKEEVDDLTEQHERVESEIREKSPRNAALVLSLVDEQGQQRDGYLRAHQIFNLNLAKDAEGRETASRGAQASATGDADG